VCGCANLSGQNNQNKKQRPEIAVEGEEGSIIAEPGGRDWRAAGDEATARVRR